VTLSASLTLGNGAYDALSRGAIGAKAVLRRIRLAGFVDVDWLSLGDGAQLSAPQVADLRDFLASDHIRPLLSMTAFAMTSVEATGPDLLGSLRDTFVSEAQRWQVTHKAGWHKHASEVFARVVSIYNGATEYLRVTEEEAADELRNFTAFLATPLSDALATEGVPSDFGSRLAELLADVGRVAAVSRTTKRTLTQIRAGQQMQPISSLSQADIFLDFQQLYVPRTFVDVDTNQSVPSEGVMLGGFPFRAVLLGAPGAGKSTFVKHLVRSASDETHRDVQVPALELRCREYVRSSWSKGIIDHLLGVLDADFALTLHARDLDDLLLVGRAIVVFDGLDEITNQTQRAQMVGRIQAFAARFPAVSILVTTREIGYERAPLARGLMSHLRLEEFSDEQVEEYIGKWFVLAGRENLRQDFLNDSDSIVDIRRNPLLLSLLCMLYREPGAIPLNRRGIYSQCANELFHRWDARRQIQQVGSMPEFGDHLMREIARWFYETPSTSGGLDEQVLTKVISMFMRDSLGFDPSDAEASAQDFLDFCADRLWLLSRVGSGHGGVRIFNFTHRTFYEYFAADSIARRVNNEVELADRILRSYEADATSVLPELLIQAYDAYRERGAANVYDDLCTRPAPITLLLRLMEGALLPAYVRKSAFDLLLRSYIDRLVPPEACRSLFALTSSARKHLIDHYVLQNSQPVGRRLLLDAWASFQLAGRWTGRTIADWLPVVEQILEQYGDAERDTWTAVSIANWYVIRGETETVDVNPWQFLVCETLAGWVPGAVWWALDAELAGGQSIDGTAPVVGICRRLLSLLEAGNVLPEIFHRLGQALSQLAIDQLPWDLRPEDTHAERDVARSLLVMIALAATEAGWSHLLMAVVNSSGLRLDELVLERQKRLRGHTGPLSLHAQEVLAVLPAVCRRWTQGRHDFCWG
jgi:hypothetical protein